jgi:hypothetical protein
MAVFATAVSDDRHIDRVEIPPRANRVAAKSEGDG